MKILQIGLYHLFVVSILLVHAEKKTTTKTTVPHIEQIAVILQDAAEKRYNGLQDGRQLQRAKLQCYIMICQYNLQR